jgi:hypothetical protein
MTDILIGVLNGILMGLLAVSALRNRSHVASLRAQLGLHGIDTWELRCEACGRRLASAQAVMLIEDIESPDGRSSRTVVRAWHSDRPRCSAAFATDDQVLSAYLGGGPR